MLPAHSVGEGESERSNKVGLRGADSCCSADHELVLLQGNSEVGEGGGFVFYGDYSARNLRLYLVDLYEHLDGALAVD